MSELTLTRRDDGAVFANAFPEQVLLSARLLEMADPALLRRDGDRVYFTVANGEATYLVVGEGGDHWGDVVLTLSRLYARLGR